MLKSGTTPDRGSRRIVLLLAVVLAVALAAGSVIVLVNRDQRTDGPGPVASATPSGSASTQPSSTQPSASTRPSTSARPSSSPTSTVPSSAPTNRRSAADSLSTFFSSAGVLDRQLKEAAAAINASGPPWTAANPGVAQKVRAAKLAPVAGAIPAGMSHDLLQSVVLVLSDLTSRRYAMGSFEFQPPDPYANLLRELRNGHPAAARYADDVAAARALARSTAPLAPVPGSSRRTAEVLLLVRYVTLANGGCGSRGGTVLTRLPEVVWGPVTRNPEADGTVGGVAFSADLDSDGRWQVNLFAC